MTELIALRWQIVRGRMLESFGTLTGNYYNQLAGRQLRLEAETQFSLSQSRRLMEARRKRAVFQMVHR